MDKDKKEVKGLTCPLCGGGTDEEGTCVKEDCGIDVRAVVRRAKHELALKKILEENLKQSKSKRDPFSW